ncbi:hypothetical protein Pmar_PMAR025166, partial [Perkinsus marinus ATCC 50983]
RGYAHVTLADESAFAEALKLDGSKAWAGGSGRQRWLKVTEAKSGSNSGTVGRVREDGYRGK